LRTLDDLRAYPFLTKDDIRNHKEEMVTVSADQRGELVPFTTGGSSGEPVKFYVDRGRISNEWASCWRARSWWGLDWGDRWIWLWGSPIELTASDKLSAATKRLRDYLLNRQLLSAFNMSETMMTEYAEIIRANPPRYIYAYASA